MAHHLTEMHKSHYWGFAAELTVDFAIMYLVMYTMNNSLSDFHFNLDNVDMTLMMVAPIVVVMLIAMHSMFPAQRLNCAIIAVSRHRVHRQLCLRALHNPKSFGCHPDEAAMPDAELAVLCR